MCNYLPLQYKSEWILSDVEENLNSLREFT